MPLSFNAKKRQAYEKQLIIVSSASQLIPVFPSTDFARKMSLDLRMIDPAYEDHIDNKASHCAKMLNDYYQKNKAQKGTQFVFSDLGTYKPGEWNVYSEIICVKS